MSKLLPPRKTDPTMCTAYGCPLLGSMSSSAHGGSWTCFAHFGKEVGQFQRITAQLHRLKWLLKAISDIRIREQHADYPAAYQRIEHDFALAQRKDLLQGPEATEEWLVRLENELMSMLKDPQEQVQDDLPLITA